MAPILGVTVSTGRVGRMVAERIAAAGVRQRLIVRDPARAPEFPGDVAVADYLDLPASKAALEGVTTLFMVSAPEKPDRLDPDPHVGQTYSLTGPEQLSFGEIAATTGARQGREVRYVDESIDEAYASRQVYDATQWQLDAWVSTYTSIAAGEMSGLSTDVEMLTGHRPTSPADLLTA